MDGERLTVLPTEGPANVRPHPSLNRRGAALTQDGLALRLDTLWEHEARYVAAWGSWYFYDDAGCVWRRDETLEHMTRVREFLREIADSVDDKKMAAELRRADTVAKVVSLARSNPSQVATVAQWDGDPFMLGTPHGTLDLNTGQLRRPRPEDYITRSTSVPPAPAGTPAPLWDAFLHRITAGDDTLRAYLQRFVGYALTGSIEEHVFAFGYGGGANGKSVFLNTIKAVLGGYASSFPTEMLMVSNSERHPTDIARLRGIRLAIGSETEQGNRWAESRIKTLTGGDPIVARFMRQDFFEYQPQFKLFVAGNHRPSLRGVDEAMRRRLHLVPFTVTIPEDERDPQLPEKLKPEWPAILRWAVDGCLGWQREGLNPPAPVRAATDEYLEGEDALALWLEDCCETDSADYWEPAGTLFRSWGEWTERAGEFRGTQKRFGQALEERGFARKRGTGGVRGHLGLRLKPTDSDRWEP